ncbi:MAG: class I SAM-dependent methyltransferase [Bacteroidales bacterium]|nr:class I SAM-dependent methyltransferase [Bacteroidales bacterium]
MSTEDLRFEYIENFGCEEDDLLRALERETALTQIHPKMISGKYQGHLLAMLIKMTGAKRVLEIGTFSGYSAICMARALPADGSLVTIEVDDEIEWLSSKYFEKAGMQDKITAIVGDASKVVPTLDGPFDMVFVDGDKREYISYFEAVLPKLSPNGIIVADNVIWYDKIFTETASNDHMTHGIQAFNKYIAERADVEKIILPVRDGLMLIRKK